MTTAGFRQGGSSAASEVYKIQTGDALASTAAITAVDLCSERMESAIETPVVFIVDQGDALGGMQHSRSEGYFFYPLS